MCLLHIDQMNLQYCEPTVQNVVSFALLEQLGAKLFELKDLAIKVSGSRYNKKRFPALVIRKTKPKSTILLFSSGKMIIIGSETEGDALTVARKISRDLEKIVNRKITMRSFKVTNIVANAYFGHKINIGKMAEDQIVQKQDSFPGAIHHMKGPVKAALIFSSGKVIFTGASSAKNIEKAFDDMKSMVLPYQISNLTPL